MRSLVPYWPMGFSVGVAWGAAAGVRGFGGRRPAGRQRVAAH